MKMVLRGTLIILFSMCISIYGEDLCFAAGPGMITGDAKFDTILGDINAHTHGDNLSDFISNLSLSYEVPKIKIENMLFTLKMTPSDAFMAVGLANISNSSIDEVIEEYNKSKGKGWGVIAKNLGIKPGSKEFQALKNGGSEQLGKIKKEEKSKKNNEGKNKNQEKVKKEKMGKKK